MNLALRCMRCREPFIRRIKGNVGRSDANGQGLKLWRSDFLCGACRSWQDARRREMQAANLYEDAERRRASQRRFVAALQEQGKLGSIREPEPKEQCSVDP